MKTEYIVTWVREDGIFECPFPSTDKEAADKFVAALQREERAVVLTVRKVQS